METVDEDRGSNDRERMCGGRVAEAEREEGFHA